MSPYRGVPGLPPIWIVRRVALFHLIHAARLAVTIAKQFVLPTLFIRRAARSVHHVPAVDAGYRRIPCLGAAGHDGNFRGTFMGYLAEVIQAGLAWPSGIEPWD